MMREGLLTEKETLTRSAPFYQMLASLSALSQFIVSGSVSRLEASFSPSIPGPVI
jgi:hypothetical protein